jgi:hypothetical protein
MMTSSRSIVSVLLASSALVVSGAAFADPTPRDCATASEDALNLRKQEKLKDAKDRLLVCSAPTCPAEVRDECARRMTEVTAAIPSVVFDVKDAAGNDVATVHVTMDGALLTDHLGGAAVTVDPGEHTFRFEAAPSPAVEKKLVIHEGEKDRHVAVALGGSDAPAAAAAVPAAAPVAMTTPAPAAPPAADQGESSWNGQKTAAVVIGSVGVVGVVLGAVFGASAFSKWSSAKTACGTACGPDDPAQSLKNDASSAATLSTVTFAVGGAALVGAAVLWFTAPSGAQVQVAPTVGAGATGITLRGTF